MFIASLVTTVLNELHKLPSTLVYVVVFFLVAGEASLFIGFLLPGETAVLIAGTVASQGHINIYFLCGLVVFAAILGDTIGYFVGDKWGEHLLKLPVVRHRQVLIARALAGLEKRGPIYVFLGRFTAFLRAIMPGLAGMSKMHYRRFFIANALGGLLWGIGFTLLGFYAGKTITKVERYASWAGLSLLGLIIVGVAWRHLHNKRHEKQLEVEWVAQHPEDNAT